MELQRELAFQEARRLEEEMKLKEEEERKAKEKADRLLREQQEAEQYVEEEPNLKEYKIIKRFF